MSKFVALEIDVPERYTRHPLIVIQFQAHATDGEHVNLYIAVSVEFSREKTGCANKSLLHRKRKKTLSAVIGPCHDTNWQLGMMSVSSLFLFDLKVYLLNIIKKSMRILRKSDEARKGKGQR